MSLNTPKSFDEAPGLRLRTSKITTSGSSWSEPNTSDDFWRVFYHIVFSWKKTSGVATAFASAEVRELSPSAAAYDYFNRWMEAAEVTTSGSGTYYGDEYPGNELTDFTSKRLATYSDPLILAPGQQLLFNFGGSTAAIAYDCAWIEAPDWETVTRFLHGSRAPFDFGNPR